MEFEGADLATQMTLGYIYTCGRIRITKPHITFSYSHGDSTFVFGAGRFGQKFSKLSVKVLVSRPALPMCNCAGPKITRPTCCNCGVFVLI